MQRYNWLHQHSLFRAYKHTKHVVNLLSFHRQIAPNISSVLAITVAVHTVHAVFMVAIGCLSLHTLSHYFRLVKTILGFGLSTHIF